jgi:hypothetical protein
MLLLKLFFLLPLFLTSLPTGEAQTCSSQSSDSVKTTFYCPNCGGIEVNDCLSECVGYASSNLKYLVCFDRILFRREEVVVPDYNSNNETFQQGNTTIETSSDTTYYFSYLWNDLVGMVVWFVTAGLAISAGVGGGTHSGIEIFF